MKVIIQKTDLDTCMAALLIGISKKDTVLEVKDGASHVDIMDVDTICIEAGGSGLVHLNNFDHHDPGIVLPSACIQVIKHLG
ncbi:MAG: hypothetical protein U9N77_16730, partial [Thermodesulfobacteriota bacterium]|nr:hypothetical protein [Thermodesulfobacteriota bacterium]